MLLQCDDGASVVSELSLGSGNHAQSFYVAAPQYAASPRMSMVANPTAAMSQYPMQYAAVPAALPQPMMQPQPVMQLVSQPSFMMRL